MIPIACALLSAIGFYFSLGLGDQWWLAWLAPSPILWLAFSERRNWVIFCTAWIAMALGGTSVLRAYSGSLPTFILVLSVCAPSSAFAVSVMGARRANRDFGPIIAMFTFATLWAAFDFLTSLSRTAGSVGTPAAAVVGTPVLIQIAALVGFPGITFLLGVVPAGIAATLRARTFLPACIAIGLFAGNAAYGFWRMATPPASILRTALVESDATVGTFRTADRVATIRAVDAYIAAIDNLRDPGVQLIVMPENISRIAPEWREEVSARLHSVSTRVHATVVAGFNTPVNGAQRNISWGFIPGITTPITYEKRHLVPGVEAHVFTPGAGPKVLPNGVALEICKDMDYQKMVRDDVTMLKPTVLAVPAWDFKIDGWSHARVAVLRSVENGIPMARAAGDGLLTLNDRYGRVIAKARTVGGFTVLVGNLPLDGPGGATLYDTIGDLFGWLCVSLGIGFASWKFLGRLTRRPV